LLVTVRVVPGQNELAHFLARFLGRDGLVFLVNVTPGWYSGRELLRGPTE
jgi:hypothetical protein